MEAVAAAAKEEALATSVAAAAAAKDAAAAAATAKEARAAAAASAAEVNAREAAVKASAAELNAKEAAAVAATLAQAAVQASRKRKFHLLVDDGQDPPGSENIDDGESVDFISRLPDAVLGSIVSLLPTKDGARTQAISHRWRPLWRSAPLNLVAAHPFRSKGLRTVDLIPKILSQHPGPARRFSLYIYIGRYGNYHDKVGGWLSSQALDNLQELELTYNQYYKERQVYLLPSSAYRFAPTLRVAKFSGCHLPDLIVQLSLKFPCLKQLTLSGVTTSEDALQSILSGCPALESLELKNNLGIGRLCISCQTLKSLGFCANSRFGDIFLQELVIEDTPCLERLLPLDPKYGPATIRIISAPKLKILGMLSEDVAELQLGTTVFQKMIAVRLAAKMHTVRILVLGSDGPNQDTVVNFLKCFPNLERLYVIFQSWRDMDYVRKYDPLDPIECLELHLKEVVLKNYDGTMRSSIGFTYNQYYKERPLYLLPSSAYRFAPTLRVAKFSGCHLPDLIVQLSLKFPCLKQLTLDGVTTSEDALQSILSGCPALESLDLMEVFGFGRLCVSSRTLKSIGFGTRRKEESVRLQELVIVDTPCLERLLPHPQFGSPTIRVISAPKLKILGVLSEGIAELQFGNTVFQKMIAVSLTTKMHTVKSLVLDSSGPNLDIVANFIKCFPCLERLYVTVEPISLPWMVMNNVQKYDPLDPIECFELHLKEVVLKNYDGTKSPSIDFAKFFILNAKVLKEMKITLPYHRQQKWFDKQHRLLQIKHRASQDAQIQLKCGTKDYFTHKCHTHDLSMADPFVMPSSGCYKCSRCPF